MSRRASHGIQARQTKGREEPGTGAALGNPMQLGWMPRNDPAREGGPLFEPEFGSPALRLKDNLTGTPVIPELQRR